jgi:hypothetical protein
VGGTGTKRRGCEDPDCMWDCTRETSIGVIRGKDASLRRDLLTGR